MIARPGRHSQIDTTGQRPEHEPFALDERERTWLNKVDRAVRRRVPRPLYVTMLRGFHGGRTIVGRNPGRGRVLPDFVIIGAAKAGTTSVYAWLCEHPLVRRPRRKEIHYFSFYHYRGTDWYRHHFPLARDREAFAAAHGRPFITGEASPSYLLDELAPRRMAKLLPEVKLIVSLRNPVDRAYSQFQMRRRDGFEPGLSFEQALEREEPGFGGANGHADPREWRTYLSRGRYAEQLERWLEHFPRRQLHVIEFGELAEDPLCALAALHEFLGLPPGGPEQPQARFTTTYDPMPEELRARLVEYFRPHNQRLYALLGRELDWDR